MNIAEPSILFGGIVSLCVAAAISYLGPRLGWLRFDHGRGPQRIHDGHTPRVGGIAVFSGCCVAFLVFSPPSLGAFMLVCAFPVFLIGVAEDRRTASALLSVCSSRSFQPGLLAVGLDVVITDTGFQAFDSILQIQVLAVALSICAITAHCHAVNIIDGLNGLAAGSCVAALAAVAFLAARYGDTQLCMVAMGFLAPTAGFLLLNYPRGLLFLGDGGAYLLGAVVAALVIILPTRNPEVSSFGKPADRVLPDLRDNPLLCKAKFQSNPCLDATGRQTSSQPRLQARVVEDGGPGLCAKCSCVSFHSIVFHDELRCRCSVSRPG